MKDREKPQDLLEAPIKHDVQAIKPDVRTSRQRPRTANPRQARFAVQLARQGGVGAERAALLAGYAPETARKACVQLLRVPHVRALVRKHLEAELAAAEVTESRVILKAAQWLFMTDEEASAHGMKISSRMRCRALEILARATGLVTPERHDHKHLHVPQGSGVQFVLPVNDRVPVNGTLVPDSRANGRGNGRDHDPVNLPPGAVLELPPREDEPK